MKFYGLSALFAALCLVCLPATANVTEFDKMIKRSKVHHSQIIQKDKKYAIQDSITGEMLTPFYKSITCWEETEPCQAEQVADKTIRYDGEEFPTYHQGAIDWRGKVIIKPEYERVDIRSDGFILVTKNQNGDMTYGLFDIKGREILPFSKRFVGYFSEGVATFFLDDETNQNQTRAASRKYGLIDSKGKELIAAKYDNLNPSHFGLLHAEIFDSKTDEIKNGYIDKHGNIKIPFIYQDAETFNEFGLAMVVMNAKVGFINTKGDVIIPIVYDGAMALSKNHFLVRKDGKYGIIDDKNKAVTALDYDGIRLIPTEFLSEDSQDKGIIVILKKDNQLMAIDETGKIVIKSSSNYHDLINELEKIYHKSK